MCAGGRTDCSCPGQPGCTGARGLRTESQPLLERDGGGLEVEVQVRLKRNPLPESDNAFACRCSGEENFGVCIHESVYLCMCVCVHVRTCMRVGTRCLWKPACSTPVRCGFVTLRRRHVGSEGTRATALPSLFSNRQLWRTLACTVQAWLLRKQKKIRLSGMAMPKVRVELPRKGRPCT